jgi:hypothetical protein
MEVRAVNAQVRPLVGFVVAYYSTDFRTDIGLMTKQSEVLVTPVRDPATVRQRG